MIESVAETVDSVLRIGKSETGVEFFDLVRFSVAVGVASEQDVGCRRNQHAVSPGEHTGRETRGPT